MSLTNDISANRYIFKPLGQNLYNGKVGIALFLAELYSVTKKKRFKNLVYKILKGAKDNDDFKKIKSFSDFVYENDFFSKIIQEFIFLSNPSDCVYLYIFLFGTEEYKE